MRKIIKRETAARSFNKIFANGVFEICGHSLLPKIDSQAEYFIAKKDSIRSATKYEEMYTLSDNFYIYMGFFAARHLANFFGMPLADTINSHTFCFLKGVAQSDNLGWILEIADRVIDVNADMFIKYLFDNKKYDVVRLIFEKKTENYDFYLAEDLVKRPDAEMIKCLLMVVPAQDILEKLFDFLSCNLVAEKKYIDCIDSLGLDAEFVARMAGYYGLTIIKKHYSDLRPRVDGEF
jgi:hypothetical protein